MLLVVLGLIPSIFAASIFVHEGGSCGSSSIPYKLVVDDDGKPEVFCDTAPCFKTGSRRSSKGYGAACDTYAEVVCSGVTQWTGGLLELNNGTHRTLKTECCSYQDMEYSQIVKSVFLSAGDSYTGGKVYKRGNLQGFDVVKEIRKTITSENTVQYILSVYRLPCTDEESDYNNQVLSRNKRRLVKTEVETNYDEESEEEILEKEMETLRSLRRLPAARRRALIQRLEDYYDYDYEAEPRRPYRRPRPSSRKFSDRLWPTSYPRARAHSEPTYEDKGETMVALQAPVENSVDTSSYDGTYSIQGPPAQAAAPTASESAYQNYAVNYPTNNYVSNSGSNYPSNNYPNNNFQQPQTSQIAQPVQQTYQSYQYQYPSQSYQPYSQSGYNGYNGYGTGTTPNLNTIFGRMQCFSGDMKVETESGHKLIKDLTVGDRVLSIDDSLVNYSPVIMFLHRKEHELTDFILIETDSDVFLKITDNHLIYKTTCKQDEELRLVPARDVKVGDCLHIATDFHQLARQRVSRISRVEEVGYYAPITSTGDIFVNGVLSSCHSNVAFKALQQTFFGLYKRMSAYMSEWSIVPKWESEGDLPSGVESITSVIDLFIPSSLL